MSPRRRGALLLLGLLALPACAWLRAQPLAAVAHPALDELSGMTRSLVTDRWLWAINDSGGGQKLFRLGLDGGDGGVIDIPEVRNFDWEDISAFHWQGQPALLIGDIGDNYASKKLRSLHAVRDPGVDGRHAEWLWSLHYRYSDGPRDAEAMAVDPVSGDILIISKRDRPPQVYRLPMPDRAPEPGSKQVAGYVGTVQHLPPPNPLDLADHPIFGFLRDWPTALSFAPDGRFAVVTTYKDAYLYRREPGEGWGETFGRRPLLIDLPQWKQTEAGTVTADGQRFCAGSEQRAGFGCFDLPQGPPPPGPGTGRIPGRPS